MRTGKLIVLDGIDGAGKATQTALLLKRLDREGHRPVAFDFPDYDSFFGQAVAAYLRTELGEPRHTSPYLIAPLYAGDRWQHRDALWAAVQAGAVVVANRYVPSNINFCAARLPARQRPALRGWIRTLEHEVFGIPREDATLYLSMPVRLSQQLIGTKQDRPYLHGKQRDAHEADTAYLVAVAREYEHFCRSEPTAHAISCSRAGQLLTIQAIHEKIWAKVHTLLEEG